MTIKRIAIVGPESSGKTYLAAQLASYYKCYWVPEYAREYLQRLKKPYTKSDVEKIARGQIDYEDVMAAESKRILICDTNLIVIKVWMEFKYQSCPKWVDEEIGKREYALHLIASPDIPYEEDPLREHPLQREELFEKHVELLDKLKINYAVISGKYNQRLRKAVDAIEKL
jgi:NadR type nicotinamide-nucleotide adenylyltransferase